jgi:hypothetical protein
MKQFIHKDLAGGRWFELPLMEQLGNIGSEVGRAARWEGEDSKRFQGAVERALDLFDLTMEDVRWQSMSKRPKGVLRELARAREVFCDIVYGEKQYGATLSDMEEYFMQFAIVANK